VLKNRDSSQFSPYSLWVKNARDWYILWYNDWNEQIIHAL